MVNIFLLVKFSGLNPKKVNFILNLKKIFSFTKTLRHFPFRQFHTIMEGAQSYARRDRLIEIQNKAQKLWADNKMNEMEVNKTKKKFLITFPYPYMNGRLHLGHIYSMTKAEFYSRYMRIRGYNCLFPFSFHCTGMPISAAAKKLKGEYETVGIDALRKLMEDRAADSKAFKEVPHSQWEILMNFNVPEAEIPKFTDAHYWLEYFPPHAQSDLKSLGLNVDWRRSFITTDVNPYYDSFIRWQFTTLKKRGFIKFGKRASIFCIKDDQMCADHDRSEGEGVGPQEYALVKMEVLELEKPGLDQLKGRKVFCMAATLRTETMYGQTNCYVKPEGVYGAYEAKDGEVWICAERSALNMSYQELLKDDRKVEKICDINGIDLVGVPMSAPLCKYEKIYMWPMKSISMEKGTGIVTSVPSDSPDDYANMMDLRKKPDWRAKWGLTDEMVMPFEPISIIDCPGYSDMCAKTCVEEMKIISANDKAKLLLAKETCYQKGFYEGIMKVGEFAGQKVQDVKPLVKAQLVAAGKAKVYYEPENKVVSRGGEDCIVALCDQWFLDYGCEKFKTIVLDHVKSDKFNSYNDSIQNAFEEAIGWLKQWGCSRSFGLGTKIPFDEQYLVESLSDSTIYNAYYTIAHYLQGNMDGSVKGELDIDHKEISLEDWDYIFLNGPKSETSTIPTEKLETMRESFRYWYPLDFRTSGKDLIKNHLTMSLYNHAVIWEGEDMIPRGMFANGWIMVDGEKMAKSKGNVYTAVDLTQRFGADASRIAMGSAGDSMGDANLVMKEVDEAILKLSALEMWLQENTKCFKNFREGTPDVDNLKFYDDVFENQLKNTVHEYCNHFDKLVLREVLITSFFMLNHMREEYRMNCGNHGFRRDLIIKYVEIQLTVMYPIAPHFAEIMWQECFLPNLDEATRPNYSEFITNTTLHEVSPHPLKKLGPSLRHR